jgi:hypothetical protein
MTILTCSTTKPPKLQVESTNQVVVPSIVIFAVSSHRVLTQVEKIYK